MLRVVSRRPGAAAFGIALLAACGAADARAHAVLLDTEPVDGAVLAAAPAAVSLRFNEAVTPVFVRVFDAGGRQLVGPESLLATDTRLRVALPPDLPNGGYIVSYRVVSADSHPVGGALAFAVGGGSFASSIGAAADLDQQAERIAEAWVLAKIVLYLVQHAALLLASGATIFGIVVLRGGGLPRLSALIGGSVAVALAATVLQLAAQGGLLALAPPSGLTDPAVWQLGASTTLGISAAIILPALALIALNAIAPTLRGIGPLALAGAIAAPMGLALTGHSASAGWLAQSLQALHALTAAYWLGSLPPLLMALRRRPIDEAARIVRRFSALAVPAVIVLLLTGIGATLIRIPLPLLLASTGYGLLLLIKIGFVALLMAFAAVNRRRFTPALEGGMPTAAGDLKTSIRFEILLGAGVLIITAFLAHTPPPHDIADHDHASAIASPGYAVMIVNRDYLLLVDVIPGRAGRNGIELYFSRHDGAPVRPQEVAIEVSRPDIGIEPLSRAAMQESSNRYRAAGLPLSPAGPWRIRVDALISDFEKSVFETEIPNSMSVTEWSAGREILPRVAPTLV